MLALQEQKLATKKSELIEAHFKERILIFEYKHHSIPIWACFHPHWRISSMAVLKLVKISWGRN
jgi:hypothetical protein